MSFVPANQNWWCNPCLSTAEGEAPSGLAAPTVDEAARATHVPTSSPEEGKSRGAGGASFDLFDLLDPALLGLLFLAGGGILIYLGHYIIGGLMIFCVLGAGIAAD